MGFATAPMGDVDGDGVNDYLTTAPYADDKYNGPIGRAYLYSGADGSLIREHVGTSYGGRLGMGAANVGDLDGDGVDDYTIGIPYQDRPNGRRHGRVDTFSGASGQLLWQVNGFGNYWLFGREIEGVGDVNGDGVPDLMVSAPEADTNFVYNARGKVYLLSGVDGAVLRVMSGQTDYDYMGAELLGTGDLNGDGVPDMAVTRTAYRYLFGPTGEVQFFSGSNGELLYSIHGGDIGNDVKGFGWSMAMVGDWDQDGVNDIAISATQETPQEFFYSAGSVRVFSGRNGDIIREFFGDHIYIYFGLAVAGLEDFDGDGFPDLAVGSEEGIYDGGVRIYSGRDGRELWRRVAESDDAEFGFTIADGGDLNGDGRCELLVSSWEDGVWNSGNGRLHVISYNPHLLPQSTVASASAGGSFDSQIDFPASEAGKDYALLLSETGMGPSEYLWTHLPLTKDAMFWNSVNGIYPSQFLNATGVLDGNGDGQMTYQWAAGQLSASIGRTYWASVVSFDPGVGIRMVSAAAPLTVTP